MFTIATWNINSLRIRGPLIQHWLQTTRPDVLCLQETKVTDEQFPHDLIAELGFSHYVFAGQKSYNGVAILARQPLELHSTSDILQNGEKRHIAANLANGITVHNFYVPAGGDEPDVDLNPKFRDKLAFVDYLTDWSAELAADAKTIMVGDLNIAPLEHDVWSSKQLRNVVSHTDIEREKLLAAQKAGNWCDAARHLVPANEKLYSWWSYRNRDWRASNRGRRLDHIWVSPALQPAIATLNIASYTRDLPSTSDHVPVALQLKL
jgi:exodeoxyribonuclease-3